MVFLVAAALLAASTSPLTGQLPSGAIIGVVTDPSGATIPAASIRVLDLESGVERHVETANDGAFVVPGLPPGTYRVTVSAPPLAAATRSARVDAGETTRLDLALAIDPIAANVVVDVTLPLLHVDHHNVSGVVHREQIEQLPLNGREFLELARLEPGVTAPVRGTNNRTFVAILGAGLQTTPRIGATRVTIDGASVAFPGAIGSALKLSPEAVEEFQLVIASFDVSTSLTASGAVNIVSRAGGNTPSGGALVLYRDQSLSAYPGLRREPANPDPSFRRHHESAWFGGPLRRDWAFLFASGETHDQASVVSVQPATRDFRSVGGVFPSPLQSTQLTARIDSGLWHGQRMFVRYSHDRSRAFAPLNDRTDLLPSAWSQQRSRATQAIAAFSSVLGTQTFGQARLSRFAMHAPERPADARACSGCLGLGLPRITVADTQLALGDARTIDFDGERYQLTGDLTWQLDRHTVRALVDWEHASTLATIEPPQSASIVLWSPQRARELNPVLPMPTTFQTVADVLQLPVQSYNVAVTAPVLERGFRPHRIFDQLRVGAADIWRLAPRLTVNGSVSWTYEPNALNHDLTKPILLTALLGANGLGAPRVEHDRVSIAAGFSWLASDDAKTVLHGGAGRYFDAASSTNQVNLVMERQALMPVGTRISAPPVTFEQPTSVTGAEVAALIPQLWGNLRSRLNPDNRDFSVRTIDAVKTGRGLADPAFTVPYAIHANVGVQRALTSTLGVSANFVWRQFERTFLTEIDYNGFNSSAGPRLPRCLPVQRNDVSATCSNGAIQFDATAGHARYRGLLARVEKRFTRGLQLLASYALSHFRGTNGTGAGSGFDLEDWYANDGPLPTDRRHVANVSGFVMAPWRLQFAWNASFASAPPMSVFVGGADFNGDGTRGDLLPGSTVNQFRSSRDRAVLAELLDDYNRAWADQPLCCDLGPAPRLTLPADYAFEDTLFTLDVRVGTTWSRRAFRVAVFADIFNLLNIANLVQTNGNLLNPGSFGQPSARGSQVFGAGGPRAVQFGSRVVF